LPCGRTNRAKTFLESTGFGAKKTTGILKRMRDKGKRIKVVVVSGRIKAKG
jgi:hypothetical protein